MTEPVRSAHERWDELAAGYALHALEPAEAGEFERHLDECARCRATTDEMSFVAAQLGTLSAGRDEGAPSWRHMRPGILGASGTAAPAPRGWGSRRLLPIGIAAAVLAGGVALAVGLDRAGTAPTLTVAACERSVDCHRVTLRTDAGRVAATVLVRNRTVSVASLPLGPAAAGKSWVLWQVSRDGRPLFVRSFDVAPSVSLTLPTGYDDTSGFAISEEPAGSRPARPSRVVATVLVA